MLCLALASFQYIRFGTSIEFAIESIFSFGFFVRIPFLRYAFGGVEFFDMSGKGFGFDDAWANGCEVASHCARTGPVWVQL